MANRTFEIRISGDQRIIILAALKALKAKSHTVEAVHEILLLTGMFYSVVNVREDTLSDFTL